MHDKLMIFHIDMNFVSLRTEYLTKWLRKLSEMGYNAILWELEDKVQWESCPECIWPEAISKSQFRDILELSRSLGLEPIPLLQTIGHGEYILKQEEYMHLREVPEYHDCYCTTNLEARDFLSNMIHEYLELFGDISVFHLGGDEAYVFASCPSCAKKAEQTSKNALYAEHMEYLSKEIRQRGIRPGIWGDMVLRYPENIDAISTDFVIWDWNYTGTHLPTQTIPVWGKGKLCKDELTEEIEKSFPEILDRDGNFRPFYTAHALVRSKYDVILCSASRAAGDSIYLPKHEHRLNNVIAAAQKTVELNLSGNCVTSWAIRFNNYETQEIIIRAAPCALNNPNKTCEELISECGTMHFGISPREFLDAASSMSSIRTPFCQHLDLGIQWNGLKDSSAPPRNYTRGLLNKWEEDGSYEALRDNLYLTEDAVRDGLSKLNVFIGKVKNGFELLHAWSNAANHQLWLIRVARMVFEDEAGSNSVILLKKLKDNTREYFSEIETPVSSEKNASLVFDSLIEYFESC